MPPMLRFPAISTAAAALLFLSSANAQSPAGRIDFLAVSNSVAHLQFESAPGRSYQLQRVDLVSSRWWSDVGQTLSPGSDAETASSAADSSAAFYRVLEFTNSVFWYDWSYRLQSPALSQWGLGDSQTAYVHCDRPCDWYVDQADTGAGSNNNCGPSSTAMAIKWHNPSSSVTAEQARDWSYGWRGNGWWYTSDVTAYLALCSVPCSIGSLTNSAQLAGLLADGNLVVLCLNTAYLPLNANPEQRVGRFYGYAGGHFLVVKGARTVSGQLFFETYDPNNWHAAYADGSPKGRNRHLLAADLASAVKNWWPYAIVVPPPSPAGKSPRPPSPWLNPVDPRSIPHAPGR